MWQVAQKRATLRRDDFERIAESVGASREAVRYVMTAEDVTVKSKATDDVRLETGRKAFERFLLTHRGPPRRAPTGVAAELGRLRSALLADRHQRNIAAVLAALADAGLSAYSTSDGRALDVGGTRVFMPGPEARWEHDWVMQKIAREALEEHLVRRVADNLSGLPLRALPTSDGIVLSRRDRVIGRVSATRALVAPRTRTERAPPPIDGNFFADGDHWHRLRAALIRLAPPRLERASAVPEDPLARPTQVLTELPASVSAELRELAVLASQLVRHDRTVAFAHTVELRLDSGEVVRVEPIRTNGAAVEAPFTYETVDGRVAAAIRLKSPRDPMAIALDGDSAENLVGDAWVTGLVAFADMTCVPQSTAPQQQRAAPARRRSAMTALGSKRDAKRHGQTTLSARLAPSSATAVILASYVVGHRRRLRDGQTASLKARREAERAGIALRPQETWVQPHVRGVPPDTVLVFSWTPPDALARPDRSGR